MRLDKNRLFLRAMHPGLSVRSIRVQLLYSLITVDHGLGHPSIDGIRECLGDVEGHGSFA
jgi:hypothetical protein